MILRISGAMGTSAQLDIRSESRSPEMRPLPSVESPLSSIAEPTQRGFAALGKAARDQGVQTTSGDPTLRLIRLQNSELRPMLRKLGIDLGFDAGPETFCSAVAAKLLWSVTKGPERSLVHDIGLRFADHRYARRYNYFVNRNAFPCDTDTTSVTAASLFEMGILSKDRFLASARELLQAAYRPNPDDDKASVRGLQENVVMVYWTDGTEPKATMDSPAQQDAVVAANALYALLLAQEQGLDDPQGVTQATLRYVAHHLTSDDYLSGTRYYASPDAFLCFLSCVCRRFPQVCATLATPLEAALRARESAWPSLLNIAAWPTNALNTAMRIIAAENLNFMQDRLVIDTNVSCGRLAAMQRADGLWPRCAFFKYGALPVHSGSEAVSTVFALRALSDRFRIAA